MHYYLPRSASWIEEMEKRSRRRTRDLVALAASQGLSQNEIGCARISMMARSINAPCKGRIQKRKTTLHLLKSGLQRHGRSIQTCQEETWERLRKSRPRASSGRPWGGATACGTVNRCSLFLSTGKSHRINVFGPAEGMFKTNP